MSSIAATMKIITPIIKSLYLVFYLLLLWQLVVDDSTCPSSEICTKNDAGHAYRIESFQDLIYGWCILFKVQIDQRYKSELITSVKA